MGKSPQKIVGVRLPKLTYNLLHDRSQREEMSVSALIRNILIGFLKADDVELEKIRCYGASKAQAISKILEEDIKK